MNRLTRYLKTILKVLILIVISVFIATLLMTLIYSLPLDRLIVNARNSINVYSENIIKQWAGWSRYSHISNTSDEVMINEAICRPYSSTIKNALLNPHFKSSIEEYFINSTTSVENFGRYWHGYLTFIIPCLLFTNAGGIRMIELIIQVFLIITMLIELSKYNKLHPYLFGVTILFINPITTAISFEDADIFVIMMLFSIFVLRYNEWLKKNDRYVLLFTLNGIFVAFFDFLTYPLVAWGIPLSLTILINKNDTKQNLTYIITRSLSWIVGYSLMWVGKWIVASIFTGENILLDGINQVLFRTAGNGYSYIETLSTIWESINDFPMLLLYLIEILIIAIYLLKNRLTLKFDFKHLYTIIPLLLIAISPFVWYFVVRNHSFVHPWFEYRELAITVWLLPMICIKLFSD